MERTKIKRQLLASGCEKSATSNITHKWILSDFKFFGYHLSELFILPYCAVLKNMAFRHKVLNNILFTNDKLYKVGFRTDHLICTFCAADPETLYHFLYKCPYSRKFWNDFNSSYSLVPFINSNSSSYLAKCFIWNNIKQCPSTYH